jgi:hypothetical protein
LVDKVIVAMSNAQNEVLDHFTLKCGIDNIEIAESNVGRDAFDAQLQIIVEELRSAILKIGLVDSRLPKLPEGSSFLLLWFCLPEL